MYAIGEVAKRTGLKVPTIRFYEQEGLLAAPPRTASGRRLYSDSSVRRLASIRHARALGFELADIRSLLNLADHPERPCADADRIAQSNLNSVRGRIERLRALEQETCAHDRCVPGRRRSRVPHESLGDHGLCAKDTHSIEEPRSRRPVLTS